MSMGVYNKAAKFFSLLGLPSEEKRLQKQPALTLSPISPLGLAGRLQFTEQRQPTGRDGFRFF